MWLTTSTTLNEGEPKPSSADGGDLLAWILCWSELGSFGALLIAFTIVSWLHPDEVAAEREERHRLIPITNTAILLTSGWFAATAASQKKLAKRRVAFAAAAVGGLAFVAIELYECRLEQVSLSADDARSTLYAAMTGFHLAHCFSGHSSSCCSPGIHRPRTYMTTIIWHVLDIVWLVMFPMVYLI
ncbi:cytochrome c oxidase subunit 3 family protein [Rhizobium sp. P40RR-XXII]|uniref:cytochrome c oxidase subunit 3 family protein n=1 Tax=Rhizobium sp. P40RR-XXII TaxID=2726739 RepID=UPI001FEFEBF6|nr:cytochrome c oxidase subunit 3 family protein [Rhizobium sp. P40RR-XXII]